MENNSIEAASKGERISQIQQGYNYNDGPSTPSAGYIVLTSGYFLAG